MDGTANFQPQPQPRRKRRNRSKQVQGAENELISVSKSQSGSVQSATVVESLVTLPLEQSVSDPERPTPLPLRPTQGNKKKKAGGSNVQLALNSKKKTQIKMTKRDAKTSPSQDSGGIPIPTKAYILGSKATPQAMGFARPLLVIIDLNGTILHRPSRSNPTKFVERPHAKAFLKYCTDTFTVVIWSSARPENVNTMCRSFLTGNLKGSVLAIWGRDRFGLTPVDYDLRVQCYKRLTTLWEDPIVSQSHPSYHTGGRWDQTNTVYEDTATQ